MQLQFRIRREEADAQGGMGGGGEDVERNRQEEPIKPAVLSFELLKKIPRLDGREINHARGCMGRIVGLANTGVFR